MTEEEEARLIRVSSEYGRVIGVSVVIGVVLATYLERLVMWVVDGIVGGPARMLLEMIESLLDRLLRAIGI